MALDDQQLKANLQTRRILIPVLLGVGVVLWLFWRNFDQEALQDIQWNRVTIVFFSLAVFFLIGRILFYTLRLRLLSDGAFSLRKAMQLIFIWEFSSAVSPTNVGGSAVALFVLSQEKIGAARTSTIVIYTIVLDTVFVMIAIPIWYAIYGSKILGAGSHELGGSGGWEVSLWLAYTVMSCYGMFLLYALLRKPEIFQRIASWVAGIRFLRRYEDQLIRLGSDIKIASQVLFAKDVGYHLKALFYTVAAWSCRFLLIIALLAAFTQRIGFDEVMALFARIQTMFVLIAFSPTPGGSGLAEALFGNLLSDIVPVGAGVLLAMIWRGLAYYFFLLVGIAVIPGWLNEQLGKRKAKVS